MSIKTHKLAIMASILVVAVSLLSVFLLKDNQRSHDTIALSKAVTQSPSLIEPKNPEDPAEKLKRETRIYTYAAKRHKGKKTCSDLC